MSSVRSAPTSLTPEEEAEQVREKIANDLKTWQEKFAKAAAKGTEELDGRVREITDHQVDKQVHGVGEALLVQLEVTTGTEYTKLKKSINKTVRSLPEELTKEDVQKAEEDVAKSVRSCGQAVKAKAQALRTWKQRFENETESLVLAASDSTLEVIDNIRDLGLQEVGMRWAWMEGVTYKDWSNYHSVKKTFDKWRNEVEAVAKDHPSLLDARSAAEDIEAKGMAIAEDAAKELTRLKEVGMWKIQAGDHSDDFDTKYVPAKAVLVGKKIVEGANSGIESITGTSQGTFESIVSQATGQIDTAASTASSQLVGTEPGFVQKASDKMAEALSGSSTALHESVASGASIKFQQASEYVLEAVVGTSTPVAESVYASISTRVSEAMNGTPQPKAESVVSAASKKADLAAQAVSQAVVGSPAPIYESVASEVSRSAISAASVVSDSLPSLSTPLTQSASSIASSISDSVSSAASQASMKVFAGAMAQEVREHHPILDDVISDDDDSSYSEKMQSVISQARDNYADVTKAVSEALGLSTRTQGSVESATSLASEQYSSALAAASRALYGEGQGTGEMVSSIASTKYFDAVSA